MTPAEFQRLRCLHRGRPKVRNEFKHLAALRLGETASDVAGNVYGPEV